MASITPPFSKSSIQSDIIQPYTTLYNTLQPHVTDSVGNSKSAWPNSERYKQHRERKYTPPAVKGKRPPLLALASHRLDHLITKRHGHLPWNITGIKIKATDPDMQKRRGASPLRVRLGVIQLHHHPDKRTPSGGKERRRRDQAVHSADIVLRYLLGRCNVQHGQRLEWLECSRTSVDRIAEDTRLSRSAARDGLELLCFAGFVRSKRVKERTADGLRERPARRWLTPHLFAALGLGRPYLRQLRGGRQAQEPQQPQQPKQASVPASPAERKPQTPPSDEQRAKASSKLAEMRNLIKGRPPS